MILDIKKKEKTV